MTTLREAAQQALDEAVKLAEKHGAAVGGNPVYGQPPFFVFSAEQLLALKAALAEPEQEPVAWKDKTYGNLHHQDFGDSIPLYTAPPQRKEDK